MIRRALQLTTPSLIVQQLATAIVVFLLFLLWLRVPDSSWVYVLATLICTAILVAAAGAGETRIALKLTQQSYRDAARSSRATYVRGTAILLVAFALWLGWEHLLTHLSSTHDALWAGYWNSRLSAGMRNVFSYEHLTTWLGWFWSLLESLGMALLAAVSFHLIASPQPKLAIRRNLRSLTWWVVFLVGIQLSFWLAGKITNWTPGHGLGVEAFSFLLRSVIAAIVSAAACVFLLATMATFTVATDVDAVVS